MVIIEIHFMQTGYLNTVISGCVLLTKLVSFLLLYSFVSFEFTFTIGLVVYGKVRNEFFCKSI